MLMIHRCLSQGEGLASALIKRAAVVEIDWDLRQRSRFSANDATGRALGVVLPRGQVVRGGDVLVAEDGSLLRVVAAPQPVLVVRATSPFALLRAAYHLGNRHVPLEVQPELLKLEPDPVLADMLRQMGLSVVEANEGFEPEGGAYASGGHAHGHDHVHDELAAGAHVHDEHCGHHHHR